jgi:hypothetical protein
VGDKGARAVSNCRAEVAAWGVGGGWAALGRREAHNRERGERGEKGRLGRLASWAARGGGWAKKGGEGGRGKEKGFPFSKTHFLDECFHNFN